MYKRCLLIHLLFLCFVSFREDGVLDVCVVERLCVDVCVGEEVLRCKIKYNGVNIVYCECNGHK